MGYDLCYPAWSCSLSCIMQDAVSGISTVPLKDRMWSCSMSCIMQNAVSYISMVL